MHDFGSGKEKSAYFLGLIYAQKSMHVCVYLTRISIKYYFNVFSSKEHFKKYPVLYFATEYRALQNSPNNRIWDVEPDSLDAMRIYQLDI